MYSSGLVSTSIRASSRLRNASRRDPAGRVARVIDGPGPFEVDSLAFDPRTVAIPAEEVLIWMGREPEWIWLLGATRCRSCRPLGESWAGWSESHSKAHQPVAALPGRADPGNFVPLGAASAAFATMATQAANPNRSYSFQYSQSLLDLKLSLSIVLREI